jgi:hypothetical protein
MLEWGGIVEVVRELAKTLRKLAHGNARLLWTQGEEDFWKSWAHGTLPQIIAERSELPLKAIRRRQELIRERARDGVKEPAKDRPAQKDEEDSSDRQP